MRRYQTIGSTMLFGASLLAALLASPAQASDATLADAPRTAAQAPAHERIKVGKFDVVALSDGSIAIPLDQLLLGATPGHIAAVLAARGLGTMVDTPINAFLIDTGKHRVLVDTGAGNAFGAQGGGRLPDSLRAAGYQPADIDAILLTHIHGDHSNGLTVDGKPVFPNAVVHVERREAALWLDPAKRTTVGEQHGAVFDEAKAAFAPYIAAGKVKYFDAGAEVVAGVHALAAFGHTPGHVYYEVRSGGQRLRFLGDLIHAEAIQFAEPQVAIRFDVDPSGARRERAALFAEAAQQGYLTAAAHIAFPGVGRITRDGKGYRWVPVKAVRKAAD